MRVERSVILKHLIIHLPNDALGKYWMHAQKV